MDENWEFNEANEFPYLGKEEFIESLKTRTKNLVLRYIKLFQALPKSQEAGIIGKQLLRAATSVGANYRASCRSRSKGEFYSKLSITVEEADEALFWLEILEEAGIVEAVKLTSLKAETLEILKILAKARGSTK